jgi:hypothetical protein
MQEISAVDPNPFLPPLQIVVLHGFNSQSFMIVLADVYETSDSCARCIRGFLRECSSLAPISSDYLHWASKFWLGSCSFNDGPVCLHFLRMQEFIFLAGSIES